MSERSGRDLWNLFRRRVAPIVFLVALVALAARTCAAESASAEIRFLVGDAGPEVRAIEVELRPLERDEVLGHFQHNHPGGSPPEAGRWVLTADPGSYLLLIDVRTTRTTVRVERAIEIRDGAVIAVDLERDLGP